MNRDVKCKQPLPSSIDQIKGVHVIGIAGTLMGAFSIYLKKLGISVTGSDQQIYAPMSDLLSESSISVNTGFSEDNIKKLKQKPDVVIIGNVVRPDNPEAIFAIKNNFCFISLPEFMKNFFLEDTKNIVVSGTHGKTTTSSLLSYVLYSNDINPNYFVGGVCHNLPSCFHISDTGKNHPFVIEGDEYDTAFWDKGPKFFHYLPDHVVLTSIEFDHADIYTGDNEVYAVFEKLVKMVRPNGKIIACVDFPMVLDLIKKTSQSVVTYGSDVKVADYSFNDVKVDDAGTSFNIIKNENTVDRVKIRLFGRYNILNTIAVWIEAKHLGLSNDQIKKSLFDFTGVKRRQEIVGVINGVTVIDDFAHHPTSVKETLEGLRGRYKGSRLIAVFEPRSATSRRSIFQKEYEKAFEAADEIWVSLPFDQTEIPVDDRFSTRHLIEHLRSKNKKSYEMDSVDQCVLSLAEDKKQGDVIVILSNGGFDQIVKKLLKSLG